MSRVSVLVLIFGSSRTAGCAVKPLSSPLVVVMGIPLIVSACASIKTLTWGMRGANVGAHVIGRCLSFRPSVRHLGVMRAVLRFTRRLLFWLGFVVLLLAAVVTGMLWLTLPPRSQQARIPGLSGPVDISFDADGIPRIHAASATDAAAALGFVHARDRMFQMDLMRRAASGRLSEIAGPATLAARPQHAHARFAAARRGGLRRPCPRETRAMLEAYARGVNAWIAERGRFSAPEFLYLGTPEPWEPVDSLLWGETMGLWLSLNWRTELSRQSLAGTRAATVDRRVVAAGGAARDGRKRRWRPPLADVAQRTRRRAAALPRRPTRCRRPLRTNGRWTAATPRPARRCSPAIRIWRSASPASGTWRGSRRRTACWPAPPRRACPSWCIGHNGHIAWTFTTTGADVQDVFIETPVGDRRIPDARRPASVHCARGAHQGPRRARPDADRARDAPRPGDQRPATNRDGPILAVSMANLAPGNTAAAGLLALNQARDVDAAGKAAAMITAPVQNLLVADRQRIALYVTGRVPIRRAGDGSAPVPGDGSHDWIGWASGDQLPHIVAPASGRLVNANDRVAPPDFPVFLGRDWFGDWRATRIRELLGRSDRHTAADFARMQVDVHLQLRPAGAAEAACRAGHRGYRPPRPGLLHDWDGAMTIDAPQPLIFNAWLQYFYGRVLQQAGIPVNDGGPLLEFVGYVLSPAGAHWCAGDCTGMLAGVAGRRHRRPHPPFRQRPGAVALGRGASGDVRSPDAPPDADPWEARHARHPQPGRRQHDRSRRPRYKRVSIGARSGVSRRL